MAMAKIPHGSLTDLDPMDSVKMGSQFCKGPVGSLKSASRGSLSHPLNDLGGKILWNKRLFDPPPSGSESIDRVLSVSAEPSSKGSLANRQVLSYLGMASSPCCHQYRLITLFYSGFLGALKLCLESLPLTFAQMDAVQLIAPLICRICYKFNPFPRSQLPAA